MNLVEQSTTYRDRVRQQLLDRNPKVLLKTIALDIGVTYEWLWMFADGRIKHPSVCRVEALDRYLNKK